MATFPRKAEEFDRDRGFAARVPIRVSGRQFQPGDQFDKSLVTTRRLRQLFDNRNLVMLSHEEVEPPAPSRPDFNSLPNEALMSWLSARGAIMRPNTPRERLILRANAVWSRMHGPLDADPIFVIPQEWLTLKWFALCDKVERLTGHRPANKAELIEMVKTGRVNRVPKRKAA